MWPRLLSRGRRPPAAGASPARDGRPCRVRTGVGHRPQRLGVAVDLGDIFRRLADLDLDVAAPASESRADAGRVALPTDRSRRGSAARDRTPGRRNSPLRGGAPLDDPASGHPDPGRSDPPGNANRPAPSRPGQTPTVYRFVAEESHDAMVLSLVAFSIACLTGAVLVLVLFAGRH